MKTILVAKNRKNVRSCLYPQNVVIYLIHLYILNIQVKISLKVTKKGFYLIVAQNDYTYPITPMMLHFTSWRQLVPVASRLSCKSHICVVTT